MAAIDAINASWLNIETTLEGSGVAGLILAAGGINAVVWFALFAVISISREPADLRPLRSTDFALIAVMTAAALLPAPLPAAGAVLLAAIYLMAFAASRRELRIALILLALTGTLIWGKLLIEVVAPKTLLRLDAQFVSLLSGLPSRANMVAFSDGRRFAIAPGCSSLHNMSLAVLMWVTAVQLLNVPMSRRVIASGVVAMMAMVLVNGLRLAAIAWFPTHFDFLHHGMGADLFGWASLILCGLIVYFGVLSVPRRTY